MSFFMPAIFTKFKEGDEKLPVVDDLKLKLSINSIAGKYNAKIRAMIYRAYNDPELLRLFQKIRDSGIYQHGSKDKTQRKILEFPNVHIFKFVDTTMTALYGPEWMKDKRALRHELVRPWLVVNHL